MDQRWGSGASLEWRRALTGDDKKVDGGQESKMRARKASLIYILVPGGRLAPGGHFEL